LLWFKLLCRKRKLMQQQRNNHACCKEQKLFSNTFLKKCLNLNCSDWVFVCLTNRLFSINHALRIQNIKTIIILLTFISLLKYSSLLKFSDFFIMINALYNWWKNEQQFKSEKKINMFESILLIFFFESMKDLTDIKFILLKIILCSNHVVSNNFIDKKFEICMTENIILHFLIFIRKRWTWIIHFVWLDWSKNQNETFCLMKTQFCLIKTVSVFCFISFHEKISDSVSFHENKIWFCLISLKKNLILSHLTKKKSDSVSSHQKKTDSVSSHKKKISFCSDSVLSQNQNRTENPDSDDLKWVKEDKVIIISCYHFLCKSESENSVSSQFCSVSSHQIEVQFCLISWKMNLILSHFTEKKFDFISLRLLSSSVSSHLMKKNLVLSHLTEKKSCLILILTQNRTEPGWEILILVVSLVKLLKMTYDNVSQKYIILIRLETC